jgi:hypothetical protein
MRILKQHGFQSISQVFGHSIEDICGLCGWILMKDSVLVTLLVLDFIHKISVQIFLNFIVKFGSKVKICRKSEELK